MDINVKVDEKFVEAIIRLSHILEISKQPVDMSRLSKEKEEELIKNVAQPESSKLPPGLRTAYCTTSQSEPEAKTLRELSDEGKLYCASEDMIVKDCTVSGPEPEPEPEPKVSYDQIKIKLRALSLAGHSVKVKELINSFDADRLDAIPKERHGELWTKINKF